MDLVLVLVVSAVFPVVCLGFVLWMGRIEDTIPGSVARTIRRPDPPPVLRMPVRRPAPASVLIPAQRTPTPEIVVRPVAPAAGAAAPAPAAPSAPAGT
jgi:hypothetical protein